MFNFLIISKKANKGRIDIEPDFTLVPNKSPDLMIRGGDFYAVWLEDEGRWSTDEGDMIIRVDREIDKYVEEHKDEFINKSLKIKHMWQSSSGMIDRFHKYVKQQLRDSYHILDEKIIFANGEINKADYATKRLSYALEEGSIDSYNSLMDVLYSPEEKRKIEWAIGSIVSGDSKKLQKFIVLYGSAGTGKSTILNIIQKLFDGYCTAFDAKSLGSNNSNFAFEPFRNHPLVAIQHDGDLSRIEDNTRLNSLVSHEPVVMNIKNKSTYEAKIKAFLFMGTNKPVKITDAKSGLIRRLIDVSPTGNTVPVRSYNKLIKQIDFELGAIAYHCLQVYEEDPEAYDDYIPVAMLSASNDFYNFIVDSYYTFKKEDPIPLKMAWDMYKNYCSEAKVTYPFSLRNFKEELKNYFEDYVEREQTEDGTYVRSLYKGFKKDIFMNDKKKTILEPMTLIFDQTESILDKECADCYAQYAKGDGTPNKGWDHVRTKLRSLDTHELHYIRLPENHIVIDFDIPNSKGEKDLLKNIEAASKWPPTYAELSKSGCGIHLHYIYTGNPALLAYEYAPHIEIKVCRGNSAIRRKLTKCNGLGINSISSGLPLKEKKEVINEQTVKDERYLKNVIAKALRKEIPPGATKTSIDFIKHILDEAYEKGTVYDVSDMRPLIFDFANGSTHNAEYCIKQIGLMKFASEKESEPPDDSEAPISIFDIEVFPNQLFVNWKLRGPGKEVVRMIEPSPKEIQTLTQMRLWGYNCRRYDNHIVYARRIGRPIEALYEMSQEIISGGKSAFIREAYALSELDIYDMSSKKQSLKKFEYEIINTIKAAAKRIRAGEDPEKVYDDLHIPEPAICVKYYIQKYVDNPDWAGLQHQELGLPWDQPVPEELWDKVAEYCDNDVIFTELTFEMRYADFVARQILADLAGMTINDTTNTLTTRIIFGEERHPQDQFNYRDMGDMSDSDLTRVPEMDVDLDYTVFDTKGKPIFPGYEFKNFKSTYRGEEVGEGGYVYAEPGIYTNVALLDIASQHPSSIVAEDLFGPTYTKRFYDILNARIAIKHKDFDTAKQMLDGKLAKYLTDEKAAKDLAQALKIAINSVYGLTAAKFDNPFRDPRNIDNIVAKRGALFMINLKHEVQHRGFTVAHIKTDSIKIPDATPEIIQFVMDYGKLYGYNFEHEATYDRMCLVNDAVYIAKYDDGKWTATGTQFQVPYVFKSLFTHEPIEFEDLCETKSVTSLLYLDMNEDLEDVSIYEAELSKLEDKYRKGKISDTTWEKEAPALRSRIEKGHNYIFIGKVGQFCPIKKGKGGGVLYRDSGNGKYASISGTKGYRWLESETVRNLHKEKDIDETYYKTLAAEAKEAISNYGDFDRFVSDEPYIDVGKLIAVPEGTDEELPFG